MRVASRVEDVCCWRPNPLLQLFYLALMGGGFALFYSKSLPLIPNPWVSPAHRLLSFAWIIIGLLIFVAASFADPGVVKRTYATLDYLMEHLDKADVRAKVLAWREALGRKLDRFDNLTVLRVMPEGAPR